MSRLFVLRGKMRLVKLGAQVVFRNYTDPASHDFSPPQRPWFFFGTEIQQKARKIKVEGGK